MTTHDSTKRIPKSIGTETKLFGTYTLSDLAVGLFPGVLVILVLQTIVPEGATVFGYAIQSLMLPLAVLAIVVGGVFVYLTPMYTSSLDWLTTFVKFHRSATEHDHDAAKEYTLIDQIHPARGVLERTDGAFLGMVQVNPPTTALATNEEWRSMAQAFQDFLNTTVEFPMQIYSTTQTFPVDEYISRYESRLSDPDVTSNPRLAALIEQYIEWYGSELQQRQMTIRDHYLIVSVSPDEVHFERESLTRQLVDLPVLGLFVQAWFAPPIEEERDAMFTALEERLRRVQAGVREIEGCGSRRVPVDEMVSLVGSFWAGEQIEYEDMERVLRTHPLIRRAD